MSAVVVVNAFVIRGVPIKIARGVFILYFIWLCGIFGQKHVECVQVVATGCTSHSLFAHYSREIVKRLTISLLLADGKYFELAAYSGGGGTMNGHHMT